MEWDLTTEEGQEKAAQWLVAKAIFATLSPGPFWLARLFGSASGTIIKI